MSNFAIALLWLIAIKQKAHPVLPLVWLWGGQHKLRFPMVKTSIDYIYKGVGLVIARISLAVLPQFVTGVSIFFFFAATNKAANMPHPPVTRLETTRGKTSIFSILIRISPGKAMIIITSAGRGDMCRSSIPAIEPRKTPEREQKGEWFTKAGANTSTSRQNRRACERHSIIFTDCRDCAWKWDVKWFASAHFSFPSHEKVKTSFLSCQWGKLN